MAKELITAKEAALQIDNIVEECAPLTAGGSLRTFSESMALADGISKLRQIFLTVPDIKSQVQAMQDTKLGFLTDRSPKAIAAADARGSGRGLKAYKYEEVAEVCIEAMLKGFRLTGNEFNMIATNFYPAKNGKYRKIVEWPELTDFEYTVTSPQMESDGNHAKCRGYASWKINGKRKSFGFSEPEKGIEDTQIFKIRVNKAMGEDAIIGKAQSKLFGRVLDRLGSPISQVEGGDLEYDDLPQDTDLIDVETTSSESDQDLITNDAKRFHELVPEDTDWGLLTSYIEICARHFTKSETEFKADVISGDEFEKFWHSFEQWQKRRKEQIAKEMEQGSLPAGAKETLIKTPGLTDDKIISEFAGLRTPGLTAWEAKHREDIPFMAPKVKQAFNEKWKRVFGKDYDPGTMVETSSSEDEARTMFMTEIDEFLSAGLSIADIQSVLDENHYKNANEVKDIHFEPITKALKKRLDDKLARD